MPSRIVTSVKEILSKNAIEIVDNTIHFLNGLTKEELKVANMKDRISIIPWMRKVVCKHQHLDTVEAKIDIINHEIKLFIQAFTPLFKKSLPFFSEEKGGMFS